MKRVSINDLNKNEAFNKEVQEIIRAEVREIIRNEYATMVQDTASQEMKHLFDVNTYGYRNILNETVKKHAVTGIKQVVLENVDIQCLIREKAMEIMDAKMNYFLHDAERRCKVAIDSMVTKQAEEIKKRLGCSDINY